MLRFKHHYSVERVAPDMVFLLSEYESHTLTGKLYYQLAPLLTGSYSASEIVGLLKGKASAPQIYYTLNRLKENGYIVEATDRLQPEELAYWEQMGIRKSSRQRGVSVHAFGNTSVLGMVHVLESVDVNVITRGGEPGLSLALADDYLHPGLAAFNTRMIHAHRPWLLVKPVGAVLWIGPLFVPGQSACWECLAQRLRANRVLETYIQRKNEQEYPISTSKAALGSTIQAGLNIAATEAARWLAGGESRLQDRIVTFDTVALQTQDHVLVRRPQCPICGQPQTVEPVPIVLQSRPKVGGQRSATAEETYRRYKQHISPLTGAVSQLERIKSPDFIHLFAAGHNKSRSFEQWQNLKRNLRSHSAGKGRTDIQAKVSGLCEAIERYSGIFAGDEARCTAKYKDIQHQAIHTHDLLLFSEKQYAERETWNQNCPPHLFVPQPFDEQQPIEWSPAWSLTRHEITYVPTAYSYYDYPLAAEHDFTGADSNGCAAGSSLEDAILQGFFELVERDGIALWWYNRLRRPAIDLDSLQEPYIQMVREYYASVGREVWVLDITSDLGIPTCVALSRRINQVTEDIIVGFGAHFEPQVAVLRALMEMSQALPAVNYHAETGAYHSQSRWEIEWWQTVTLASDPYLAPDAAVPAIKAAVYPRQSSPDLRDDVMMCIEIANRHRLDLLVLDQTRPDIGLPVVRVLVPGLRHFWSRFAPGRLYDIPVQMGWLAAPLAEAELNPRPMFL